jgi:hypothetical protein
MKTYSIEKLDAIAIETANRMQDGLRKNKKYLTNILRIRQEKLNREFVFTPENIQKILCLDRWIMDCFEKLKEEALKILPDLDKRIENKDLFLHDYEVEVKVIPSILFPDEEGEMSEPTEGIYEVLDRYLPEFILSFSISHLDSDNIHFDKSLNWNNLIGATNGELADYYISYALHELSEHALYSLSDIIQINDLWSEITVSYQHFEKRELI